MNVNVENHDLPDATICVMSPSLTGVNEAELLTDKRSQAEERSVPGDNRTDNEFQVLRVTTDGGWGWVVTIASFFINMIIDGVAYTFGLLYGELLDEFKAGRSKTALVGSLLIGTFLVIG